MRIALAAVFLAEAVAGRLCMTPVVYAAPAPEPHDAAMEMAMTPVEPMSPVNCDRCVSIKEAAPRKMSAGCAGHCYSQGNDIAGAVASSAKSSLDSIILPPTPPSAAFAGGAGLFLCQADAPPDGARAGRTVVLLE